MKTKINKILGVVLSAMTIVSLFVMASPVGVSAGTQSWTKMVTPDATGLVMPYVAGASVLNPATTVEVKGPMAQAFDGSALFVAAKVGGSNVILKSIDGGRTWPIVISTIGTGVTALAASPTEASVLYYAATTSGGVPTVYKSTNANTAAPTFIAEANITAGTATAVSAMAVSPWNGRYIVVVGTAATTANVYYMDESTAYYNFVILGTNDFAASVAATLTTITSVTLSPSYPTDRFTVAIGSAAATTYVGINQFGGAWGANISNPASISGANTTSAVGFTTDFNAVTNANFYFGLGGTANGIYRFTGLAVPGTSTAAKLSSTSSTGNGPGDKFTTSIASLDVTGTFASANIYAGNQAGSTIIATGVTVGAAPTFTGKQLNVHANANRVYVQVKNPHATTNTPLLVLVGGTTTGAADDTAFWMSTNSTYTTFHALSLINNTQVNNNLVGAPNGELFMSATGAGPITQLNDAFTITAGGIGTGDAYTITSVNSGSGDAITLSASAAASVLVTVASGSVTAVQTTAAVTGVGTAVPGTTLTLVFNATGVATLTTTGNSTLSLALLSGVAPVVVATAADTNGSFVFPGYSVANTFALDMNASKITIAGGGALNTLSATGGTIASNVWTSTAAGQVLTVTATVAGSSTWTLTAGTGTPTTAETNDPNGSQIVDVSGTPFAQDMNATITVTITSAGTAQLATFSQSATGILTPAPTSPVTPATGATINFGANSQTATMTFSSGVFSGLTVTGPTGATPTPIVTTGTIPTTPTTLYMKQATEVGVSSYTAVFGAFTSPANFDFTNAIPDFLWRNFGGNWERVSSTSAGIVIGTIAIDSAYATTNTLFYYVAGGKQLYKSTNNGDSFSSTAWTATGAAITSVLIQSGTSALVGDAAGNIQQTATSGYLWTPTTLAASPLVLSVFGGGYTVSQIVSVNATTLLAVAFSAANVEVAQGTIGTTGAVTWALLTVPVTPLVVATVNGTAINNAFITPAADFASTGNIFVAVKSATGTENGIFRFPSATSATGFVQVDNGAGGDALGINGATGIVAAPGGVAGSGDGSGLVYVADASSTGDVARVRGLEVTAEKLDAGVTSDLPGNALRTLVIATTSTSGNVQLFALGNNSATTGNSTTNAIIWTYTDQMGKQGDGVVVSNLVTVPNIITFINTSTSNATITFNTMANATDYYVVVAPTGTLGQTRFYTAADVAATQTSLLVGATTGVATYTGMLPGTSYTVNVWAACATDGGANDFITGAPVTSFRYASSATSTFVTALAAPTAPVALAPLPGAINVPVNPAFGWNSVMGATSYQLEVSTSPNFTTLVTPTISVPTTAWVWTATALSNNTDYYWRVRGSMTGGTSAWVTSAFTTIPAVVPAVVVTQTSVPAPVITVSIPAVPTIVIPANPPAVTVTVAAPVPAPILTLPQATIVIAQPEVTTPSYIWIIVGVGALLTLAVIILIIRTRRVV